MYKLYSSGCWLLGLSYQAAIDIKDNTDGICYLCRM